MDNAFFDDLLAVLQFYLQIKPAHWLDPQQGSHLTKTVASAFLQTDTLIMRLLFQDKGTS